jgi:hypothetical protein
MAADLPNNLITYDRIIDAIPDAENQEHDPK